MSPTSTADRQGAVGKVEGQHVVLGSTAFLAEHGIDTASLAGQADELRRDGATAIYIGIGNAVGGIFAIADPIKATTPEALKALHAEGIRIVMLTGDTHHGRSRRQKARHR
jgi:Cu+-exporting ATPase